MKIFNKITGINLRFCAIAMLMLSACSKDKVQPLDTNQLNGITAVINNNFSLSMFGFALNATHYSDTLAKPGPYTVICPSNTAFTAAGYASGTDVIKASAAMNALLPYLIFKKQLKMSDLQLAFDQPVAASNGEPVYFTRWQNSRDTAIVANGVRLTATDKLAANGLLNTTDGLLSPIVYKDVQEAVSGDPQLSFFNAAIIQSGMSTVLKGSNVYTVFAPANSAFAALGINSVDDVYQKDPATLQALVRAHISASRNFVYDYILKADVSTNTYMETMDSGVKTKITLVASTVPRRFSNITLLGSRSTAATVTKPNILAGNGVVHIINSTLTQ